MITPITCLYPDTEALVIACALCGHADTPDRTVLWDSAELAFVCTNRAECVRRQNARKAVQA